MVQKSKTDRAAPGATMKPGVQRRAATPLETAGSAYDSFWRCLSGRRPAERWARDEDVAPLGTLRAAFGLAEEAQPIDYGTLERAGSASTPAAKRSRQSPDGGARPAGPGANRGANARPRRG